MVCSFTRNLATRGGAESEGPSANRPDETVFSLPLTSFDEAQAMTTKPIFLIVHTPMILPKEFAIVMKNSIVHNSYEEAKEIARLVEESGVANPHPKAPAKAVIFVEDLPLPEENGVKTKVALIVVRGKGGVPIPNLYEKYVVTKRKESGE